MSCTVEEVRGAELDPLRPWFPTGVRVLDLGAGSGYQASILASWGCNVEAIDIEIPAGQLTYIPVHEYDGIQLPYPDASFDRVFSSNVLEHIAGLPALLEETARVLRPGGKAIHVMPTSLWRLSSSVAHYVFVARYLAARLRGRSMPRTSFPPPSAEDVAARKGWLHLFRRALLPGPHGEFPSAWAEMRAYTRASWRERFRSNGFAIEREFGTGVFYAGYGVLPGLTLGHRRVLGKIIGSSCNAFVLTPLAAVAPPSERLDGSSTS